MINSNNSADGAPKVSLHANVEMLASLVYLAQHTVGQSVPQTQYLDRAAKILRALRHHPALNS